MRTHIALAATLALAGCGGTTSLTTQPLTYSSIVGMLQTDLPALEAAADVYAVQPGADLKVTADIHAAEARLNPAVAALTVTSSPTTIRAALADVSTLMAVPGLPLTPAVKADITLGLAVFGAVVPAS